MEETQRRYLEGFFAGLHARGTGASVGGNNGHGVMAPLSEGTPPPDPWRVLLACAENDRPPRAGERAALDDAGVVDLALEGWDGCRLRLRAAPCGRLGAWQLRELAAVAQAAAGGFLEIGEHGGPELAVVGWRETPEALARLRAAGLAGGAGGVRCGLAAGLDAGESVDVTPLARMLAGAVGGMRVGLDGGARGWRAPEDDLTLEAGGGTVFAVVSGGMRLGVPAARAGSAIVALAEAFRRNGGGWDGPGEDRAREILERMLDGSLPDVPGEGVGSGGGNRELPWGMFPQKQPGLCALVAARPGDGLWRSRVLVALAGLTEEIGAGEARFWPGGVLVPGVAAGKAQEGLERLAGIVALVR